MTKTLTIAVAIIALTAVSGCTMYGKGKAPPPVVETNG
jgi:predicted metal-binding protein